MIRGCQATLDKHFSKCIQLIFDNYVKAKIIVFWVFEAVITDHSIPQANSV